MGARPTIYDVAREAGVAASTVSRAFSRPGRVHVDTAATIFAAARRLGYRAPRAPTGPPPARTGAVGLMVSDITNPFYGEIIKGAAEAAREAGRALLLTDCSERGPDERAAVEGVLDLVEAVVLASSRMTDAAIRSVAARRPLVLLGRSTPGTSCLVPDTAGGVRRAVEHLARLGHDTIVYLAGPDGSWADGVRWRALRTVTGALGLRAQRLDPGADPTLQTGAALAPQVAQRRATAVLAYNDALAVGLVKALHGLGVRVPEDVSVIGFDNVLLGEVLTPELTTVAAPLRAAGAAGVGNALAMADGARSSGETLVLPTRLVVRGSTGPRP